MSRLWLSIRFGYYLFQIGNPWYSISFGRNDYFDNNPPKGWFEVQTFKWPWK